MKKLYITVITVLTAVSFAMAADNGTEFGIEDDLTVLGSTGTWADPDMEVKGFSLYGPVAGPQNINAAPGNVAIRGNLQVDATTYFGSSVTIAGQAVIGSSLNVSGYGVFLSTVQMVEGNLKYGSGVAGKVLKSQGNGFVFWGDDESAALSLGSPYRLQMVNATGDGLVDSMFIQNVANTNITMISGSSLTVNNMLAMGDVDMDAKLNVDGNSTFVSSMTAKGDTQLGDSTADLHAINKPVEAGVALAVDGAGPSGSYVVKFYSGGSVAGWIRKK